MTITMGQWALNKQNCLEENMDTDKWNETLLSGKKLSCLSALHTVSCECIMTGLTGFRYIARKLDGIFFYFLIFLHILKI